MDQMHSNTDFLLVWGRDIRNSWIGDVFSIFKTNIVKEYLIRGGYGMHYEQYI